MRVRINTATPRSVPRGTRAFTMVEIALSLAVVAFGLVAIIGVLPTGMTVQRDNREDTLINQEGRLWIEAIRNGALGLNYLTNYVEQVKIEPNPSNNYPTIKIDNTNSPYLTSSDIISLLSVPKIEVSGTNRYTNRITARVRAITGPATEQSPFTNAVQNTFRYMLQSEIMPHYPLPPDLIIAALRDSTNQNQWPTIVRYNEAMGSNLWDVRLVLRWPVIERGNDWFVGNNRKTFHARISGVLQSRTNFSTFIDRDNLAILVPNKFDVNAGLQTQP